MLSNEERAALAELDERLASVFVELDGLEPGSLNAHRAALGDYALAGAAFARSRGGLSPAAQELEYRRYLEESWGGSVRDVICVTPSHPRRGQVRTVTPGSAPAWQPSAKAAPPKLRSTLWALRAALRPLSEPRVCACGHATSSPGGVAMIVNGEGRARWSGTQHCGSVHACPPCSAAIKARRADEVARLVEHHGAARVVMLTLTLRHSAADSLRTLRSGLADAWRAMARGAPWRGSDTREGFIQKIGLEGSVRALEVTTGPNGWHPHLHILLLLDEEPRGEIAKDGTWTPDAIMRERDGSEMTLLDWLQDRWATMVGRYVGEANAPTRDDIGCKLTVASSASYIQKLGLELGDIGTKTTRRTGHRTPLELADGWARYHRREDKLLWLQYIRAMKGSRQLTYSKGAIRMRRECGIVERSDQELAEDEEIAQSDDRVVLRLDLSDWEIIRAERYNNQPAATWLLAVLEEYGAQAALPALDELRYAHHQAHERQKRRSQCQRQPRPPPDG